MAVEEQRMPFVGESGPPSAEPPADRGTARSPDRAPGGAGLPPDPGLSERLAEARRRADAHRDHEAPRAPRPDRMQR